MWTSDKTPWICSLAGEIMKVFPTFMLGMLPGHALMLQRKTPAQKGGEASLTIGQCPDSDKHLARYPLDLSIHIMSERGRTDFWGGTFLLILMRL